jgi:phage/plasmid-associated DNA primase
MRTRAQVLHFSRQFKRPDEVGPDDPNVQRPDLWRQVFEQELPGVLNLLIAGFYRVKVRGSFDPPPSAIRAFDLWLSNTNAVPRFVSEACERIDSDKWEHTTSMFYDAMTMWCQGEHIPERFRPTQHTMKKRMTELGYLVKHTKAGSAVFGLRIKEKWMPNVTREFGDPEAVKAALLAKDIEELA